MLELITAHKGRGHVTALQEAARMSGLMGESEKVITFATGNGMEMTAAEDLKLKIDTGDGLVGGRFFQTTEPIFIDLEPLPEGSQNVRLDRVVFRITENIITGEENMECFLKQGIEENYPGQHVEEPLLTEAEDENLIILENYVFARILIFKGQINQIQPEAIHCEGLLEISKDMEQMSSDVESFKKSFQDGCKKIAQALTAKGVSTANNASPKTMANNVAKVYENGKTSFRKYWRNECKFYCTGYIELPVLFSNSVTIIFDLIPGNAAYVKADDVIIDTIKSTDIGENKVYRVGLSNVIRLYGYQNGTISGKYIVEYDIKGADK